MVLYAEVMSVPSIWVFGDQLNRGIGALAEAQPATHRVLFIESAAKIGSRRWHVQRAHFIVASMRKFAAELRAEGFQVDYRFAPTMREGVEAHNNEFNPIEIVATEPNSFSSRQMLAGLGIRTVASNQFLCHPDDYRAFMGTRK